MLSRKLQTVPISYTCSECLFFKKQKRSGQKKCCAEEGVKEYTLAPVCFFPDVTEIAHGTECIGALMSVWSAWNSKQRKIFEALLVQSAKLESCDHPFGSRVFLAVRGHGEFLSDWASAYALGCLDDGRLVIAGTPDAESIGRTFVGFVFPDSVCSEVEFEGRKKEMIASGKINNPDDFNIKKIPEDHADAYDPEVPTMDSVPENWLTKSDDKEVPWAKADSFEKITRVLA